MVGSSTPPSNAHIRLANKRESLLRIAPADNALKHGAGASLERSQSGKAALLEGVLFPTDRCLAKGNKKSPIRGKSGTADKVA